MSDDAATEPTPRWVCRTCDGEILATFPAGPQAVHRALNPDQPSTDDNTITLACRCRRATVPIGKLSNRPGPWFGAPGTVRGDAEASDDE